MSRDGHVISAPAGSITIEADALAELVIAAAERVEGARVRRPKRGLDVAVAEGRVSVALELAVRFGAVLPELAQAVQESVAETLAGATGLTVAAVDVSVEALDL
jgi:uncharacterized alkaline shock family protein YloU